MSDEECYDDGGDFPQDDEDEYEWHEEEEEEDDEYEMAVDKSSSSSYTPSKTGLKFEGKLVDHIKVVSKNAVYSVYRQLGEICLVDVNEDDFYSAMLTVKVKDQFIISTIQFPKSEPFFPTAPPVLIMQSHFKHPNEYYNIIFNCHPSLLKSRWNICTNIQEIISDMVEVAKTSVVDMVDDDPNATTTRIVDLIKSNDIDISGLFPNTSLHHLPSFGVVREEVGETKIRGIKGVGYSSGHGSSAANSWNFANHNLQKLKELQELLRVFEGMVKVDIWVVDTIYFIMNYLISPVITLDEFFRNFEYYSIMIGAVAALPLPSPHILPSSGLIKLYESLNDKNIRSSLEANEEALLGRLEVIYTRFQRSESAVTTPSGPTTRKRALEAQSSNNSSSNSGGGGGGGCTTSSSSFSSQKNTDTNGNAPATPLCARLAPLSASVRPRVVDLDKPFASHKFLSEMTATAKLTAKWYRRMRVELTSLPETLPNNVIVFTGMEVSQPCLLKVLMFPESEDTPYCGGCFEFDVFVPPEYPALSPKVLLVTTGQGTVRFNPNLYNCGKVCLSLLGTWSGEPWNPEMSNLTQVFNSILFLIFVERPYFNEPGFQGSEATALGKKASNDYNDVIRIATLEFGYLDHFKAEKKRQLTPWILPGLVETWLTHGRAAAVKWIADGRDKRLQGVVDAIDAAVAAANV